MSQLRDIMTSQVAFVTPQDSVQQAANLMSQHNVGVIPVVENNILRGVITDRDVVLRTVANNNAAATVADVMTANVITGTPEMSVDDASRLMAENQIRRLPIIENNQLVGIVALGDLAARQNFSGHAGVALSNISSNIPDPEPGEQLT
ncbi:IMP dehydrogenase [Marininema mesophilum]|uniref:IMP dehydrogenase n=1 Tax=Marininema mesophilum TaxID=1048340 RepID=A0A1H2VP78_9BACL|nr:CBS domain-containing protein [Marininema mesophilum]SDW70090.1 IMP dehydrogenase [Marininema mesophilum]